MSLLKARVWRANSIPPQADFHTNGFHTEVTHHGAPGHPASTVIKRIGAFLFQNRFVWSFKKELP